MNAATLARNGMILTEHGSEAADPLAYLASKVTLEKGFTLRSFLEMVRRYPALRLYICRSHSPLAHQASGDDRISG